MSTLTKEEATIERLLPDIRATHKEFIKSGQTTLDLARQIGDMLWKLKECVKHGEWTGLVESRCELQMRTARTYMEVAGGWELLEKKEAAASTINGCIKLIGQAKPKKGGKRPRKPKPPKAAESNESQESNGTVSGGTSFNVEELTGESKDAFGTEAPDELRQVFEICEEFDAQRAKLTGIKSWMTQRVKHPGGALLAAAEQRIKTDIDHLDAELKFAKPYCVCVYCQNKSPKVANCSCCKGAGWMTEQLYKAAPKGLKREKAQA